MGAEKRIKQAKGVYALFILVKKDISVKVGALGVIKFRKGSYVYIGSAQNGIRGRIMRHMRRKKKKFWHIDYLLAQRPVEIEKIIYREAKKEEECKLARALSKFGEPIRGFGCSDCYCESHLFRIKEQYVSGGIEVF